MKGAKIEIKIGGKGEMGEEMAKPPELEEVETADNAVFDEMAPKGNFTPKGLNALVKSTNKLLPAFGQTPDYPTFGEGVTVLPTDFVRVLAMFKASVEDAISEGVIGQEMAVNFDTISDDLALVSLAGKIDKLARDFNFKKFLKESPPEETNATEAGEEAGMEGEESMGEEEMDNLFMSKMAGSNYGQKVGNTSGKM